MGKLDVSVEDLFGYSKLQELLLLLVARINEQDTSTEKLQTSLEHMQSVVASVNQESFELQQAQARTQLQLETGLENVVKEQSAMVARFVAENEKIKSSVTESQAEAAAGVLQARREAMQQGSGDSPSAECIADLSRDMEKQLQLSAESSAAELAGLCARQEAADATAAEALEVMRGRLQELTESMGSISTQIVELQAAPGSPKSVGTPMAQPRDDQGEQVGRLDGLEGSFQSLEFRLIAISETMSAFPDAVEEVQEKLRVQDELMLGLVGSVSYLKGRSTPDSHRSISPPSSPSSRNLDKELQKRIAALESAMDQQLPALENLLRAELQNSLGALQEVLDGRLAALSVDLDSRVSRSDLETLVDKLRQDIDAGIERRLGSVEEAAEATAAATFTRLEALEAFDPAKKVDLELLGREVAHVKSILEGSMARSASATTKCLNCRDQRDLTENTILQSPPPDKKVYANPKMAGAVYLKTEPPPSIAQYLKNHRPASAQRPATAGGLRKSASGISQGSPLPDVCGGSPPTHEGPPRRLLHQGDSLPDLNPAALEATLEADPHWKQISRHSVRQEALESLLDMNSGRPPKTVQPLMS